MKYFGPELNQQEAEDYVERWRKLTPQERQEAEEIRVWSLCDWIYWFEPQNSSWTWCSVNAIDSKKLEFILEAEASPIPMGAMDFLLRCFDAKRIDAGR